MLKKDSITSLSGVRLVKMPRKISWVAAVIDEEGVETGEEEEEELAMPSRRVNAVVDHRASSLTLEEEEVVVEAEEEEEECATLIRRESALADPLADFRTVKLF